MATPEEIKRCAQANIERHEKLIASLKPATETGICETHVWTLGGGWDLFCDACGTCRGY